MLKKYATEDVSAEINARSRRLTPPWMRLRSSRSSRPKFHWANELSWNWVYDKYLLKGNFTKGLQDFILHSMRLFWSSDKHATMQDLVHQTTCLTNLQNGSRAGDESRNSIKPRNCHDNRRSWKVAEMYLGTDGASTRPIYCTNNTSSTTPVKMMKQSRHRKGSSSTSSFSDVENVSPSAASTSYWRLCFVCSHCAWTCPLLSNATWKLNINQRPMNWAKLLPRKAYHPGNRSLRRSRKPVPNFFSPENEAQRAMAVASQIHIFQGTMVPGTVTEPHRRREHPLL